MLMTEKKSNHTDAARIASLEAENEALREQVSVLEDKSKLGEMSGQIAHEINNLVSLVLAYTQSARQTKSPTQIDRAFDVIIDVSAKLLHLAGGIQEYLRGSACQFSIASPAEALKDVLGLMELPLGHAQISIETVMDSSVAIACDVKLLELVFINLLTNAKESLLEKAEDRRITVRTYDDEKYFYVSIADNGAGMSETVREKAFKPFFSTKKKKGKKSGIGLSVCRDIIVKRHLGKLRLESESGQGTTFTLGLHKNFNLQPKALRKNTEK